MHREERIAAAAPFLFVLFWSSGFVAAKGGLQGAPPLTFLALRFALVTAIMLAAALLLRSRWPRSRRELAHLAVTGLLMQAAYFASTYEAFAAGIGAGTLALILGLQPLVTATVAGPFLGERVGGRQWLGLLLGILGVALVLADKLFLGVGTGGGILWGFVALVAITAGTLYQKRLGAGFDIWSGGFVQYGLAAAVVGLAALPPRARPRPLEPDLRPLAGLPRRPQLRGRDRPPDPDDPPRPGLPGHLLVLPRPAGCRRHRLAGPRRAAVGAPAPRDGGGGGGVALVMR